MARIESSVWFTNWTDAIESIPDEHEQLEAYRAIHMYQAYHEEPELKDGYAKVIFNMAKPTINDLFTRRMASVENGKKGGRPKTAKSGEEPEDKADNSSQKKPKRNLEKPSHNLEKPNQNLYVNGNGNENVNGNVNGKIRKHRYGQYANVLLSDEDMKKLQTEFPNDYKERIERVSEYCASTGKTYKDYLATIRAWSRKETNRQNKREDIVPEYNVAINPVYDEDRFNEIMNLRKAQQ